MNGGSGGPYLRPEPRPLAEPTPPVDVRLLAFGVFFTLLGALLVAFTPPPPAEVLVFLAAGWISFAVGVGCVIRAVWELIDDL